MDSVFEPEIPGSPPDDHRQQEYASIALQEEPDRNEDTTETLPSSLEAHKRILVAVGIHMLPHALDNSGNCHRAFDWAVNTLASVLI